MSNNQPSKAKKPFTINMISESAFTVQGHGVHTAFVETIKGLELIDGVKVRSNSFKQADITHLHTVGFYSLIHLLFGSGKKVVSAHVVPDSFIGSLVGAKYWYGIARWYLRWFYSRADLILAVSPQTADNLKEKVGITKPIKILFNMVDTKHYATTAKDKAAARKKLGYGQKDFIIIGNGQIQTRKRFDTFVNLARQLPDYRFIWVGGIPFKRLGADYEKMMDLIENGPDNMQVTGVINLSEVKVYYQAADAFILPSIQETFGLVVVEAAAAGLPIILRDIPDYDGTFGQHALKGDDSTFPDLIQRLQTDKKFYTQAQAKAQKIVEKYDISTGGQVLMKYYQDL